MKTEGSSIEEKGESRKIPTISKKRIGAAADGRRARRRIHATSTAIQRLFLACKAVFKGPGSVPTPPGVALLQLILDKMKPEDFGLSTDIQFKESNVIKGNPPISYTTIYNCNKFSMCIFFLPPKAVIPLHNHPGMTVFSKLLVGSMHIKSYDWVDPIRSDEPSASSQCEFRLARLVEDSDFTALCDTSILYPTSGGNIHTFTAITPCAFLDILGPPYSKEEERDCTYYKDHPNCHFQMKTEFSPDGSAMISERHDKSFRWLEEIDIPKWLIMNRKEYRGPQIFDF